MFSVSAMMPWPAKAASPWMSTEMTFLRFVGVLADALARARHTITTGFTASRWLGVGRETHFDFLPGLELPRRLSVIADLRSRTVMFANFPRLHSQHHRR